MNRDIKFRSWNPESKCMTAGMHFETILRTTDKVFVDNFKGEWMQGTGLPDKHGVEIYEADIIKIRRTPSRGPDYDEIIVVEHSIFQDNEYSNWISGFDLDYNRDGDFGEIIGNIFQNPELKP